MNETIKINLIEENKGQIEGLSKNPRKINQIQLERLKNSIEESPEMLSYRTLLVYPHNSKYVIICGNMRYKACKQLGYTELPCYVLPAETPIEKIKELAIKDNIEYGEWDFDLIKNDEDWLDFFSSNEFTIDILPKDVVKDDDEGEGDEEELDVPGMSLDYSIFFESQEEYDMFTNFITDLQKRYEEIPTISGRLLQSIQDFYEFTRK